MIYPGGGVQGASSDAIIGLGATRHGLIPDGAVYRLARVVGLGRAKELALLNYHMTAAEARVMGLVNWVALPEELPATTKRIVDRFFECSRRRPAGRSCS